MFVLPVRRVRASLRSFFAAFAALSFLLAASACGIPSTNVPNPNDTIDPTAKQAIIDATNLALTNLNCSLALETIQPLYNSGATDNNVRTVMASTYACFAKISLFPLIANLGSDASQLGGSGFWNIMAKLFPSVSPAKDRVVESAGLGMDALQSVLIPGQVIVPAYETNATTFNPGSTLVSDRTTDSNFYLFFMTLAAIGGLENRYGAPDASYNKTQNLPWTTAATVTDDGCEFASAIVNMVDALEASISNMTGGLATGAQNIETAFSATINLACHYGCTNTVPPIAGWQASGCTVTTDCSTCPLSLRDRTQCVFNTVPTDQTSCAAAGIVNMVNVSPVGWQ